MNTPSLNPTSVINQSLVLSRRGHHVALKDLTGKEARKVLAQADTLSKLLILENEFALCKQRDLPYPYTWAEVNALLNASYTRGDFNALGVPYVDSMNTLKKAFKAAHQAYDDLHAPWATYTCPMCGEEISLSYYQVCWYRERGLEVPAWCENCVGKYVA